MCFYARIPADLRNGRTLGLGFSSPREGGAALLSIGEGFAIEDLEFLVLFDESEDGDNIVGEPILVGSMVCDCGLHRGHGLWSEIHESFTKRDERGRRPFPALRLLRDS